MTIGRVQSILKRKMQLKLQLKRKMQSQRCGNEIFRKHFDQQAVHLTIFGARGRDAPHLYEKEAWKIWEAAIRHERNRVRQVKPRKKS